MNLQSPNTGNKLALWGAIGTGSVLVGGSVFLTSTMLPYQSLGLLAVAGSLATYGAMGEDPVPPEPSTEDDA